MNILWFVSTPEDVNFVQRFAQVTKIDIDLFHLNSLTRLAAWRLPGKHLFARGSASNSSGNMDMDVKCSFNVLSRRLSEQDAQLAYAATMNTLCARYSAPKDDLFFMIPSGRHVHHLAATEFASRHEIPTLYINYSNFPGFTFFDPVGTDCKAAIYRNPSILHELYGHPGNSEWIKGVFDRFSALKRGQLLIPQARKSGLKGVLAQWLKKQAFIVDTYFQKIFGYHGDRKEWLPSTVEGHQKRVSTTQASELASYVPGRAFIFFPLQVSTDQQVLVNYSGGSILAALDEALASAESKGLQLVVREHPAEANPGRIREYLLGLQKSGKDIVVSSQSIYDLIDACNEVVTINSTVGLEARISGKHVKFLGKSFYEKATDEQLAIYLDKYLIPVDYHTGGGMSNEKARDIFSRFSVRGGTVPA